MSYSPSITLNIHPIKAGGIACLKMCHQSHHLEHALDLSEAAQNGIYKIDVLYAVKAQNRIRKSVSPKLIFSAAENSPACLGLYVINILDPLTSMFI